jgi:uncharacterized protein YjdB
VASVLALACGGGEASAPEPVLPGPVETIVVSPSSATLIAGDTMRLTAVLRDSSGTVLQDRSVTWSSTHPEILTVDQQGLVTAVARGSAAIVASSEGRSGNANLSVKLRFQAVSAAG